MLLILKLKKKLSPRTNTIDCYDTEVHAKMAKYAFDHGNKAATEILLMNWGIY